MHYRVLGVDSLRVQGPVEREYLIIPARLASLMMLSRAAPRAGVLTPSSRLSSVSAGYPRIFLIEGLWIGSIIPNLELLAIRRDSESASAVMAAAAAAAAVYMLMMPASRRCWYQGLAADRC